MPVNEFKVRREGLYGLTDQSLHMIDEGRHLTFVQCIHRRIIVLRQYPLPQHDSDPTRESEQLALAAQIATMAAKERELALESFRNAHVAAV